MDLHPALVIIDEAQCPEPVHKKADPRAGCAHHLCQSFLTDFGDYSLGHAILAEVGKQEQNPSKPLFAGIEKLVNQILFVSNVPRQQISYEHVGQSMFTVESLHHRFLVDAQKFAICHCRCSSHAERLTCEAAFTKKIPLTQDTYRCFLPIV